MRNKKLVIALGLVALLLVTGSIVGCGQPSSLSETHQPANPLEDITSSGNSVIKQPLQAVGWPEGSPAASGIIEKLTGNTFDIREELISVGGSGGEQTQAQVKIWQVVFSSDTRVFRPKFVVGKTEGGETPEELSVYDLEEGQNIIVWGEEASGNRIFADTIAIMSGAMLK
ncbi:hypothetical protein ES703_38011 [subsurface metagenome]